MLFTKHHQRVAAAAAAAAAESPNPLEPMYFTKQRKIAAATAKKPAPYDRVLVLQFFLKLHLAVVAAAKAKAKAAAAAKTAKATAETTPPPPQKKKFIAQYRYPSMKKTLGGNFRLRVVEGEITDSQIVVVLGNKGTGKTAFLNMLAGTIKPDEVEMFDVEMPKFNVSYKPQYLFPKNNPLILHTVRDLLRHMILDSCMNPKFVYNVMKPLHINLLMDIVVKDLSPAQAQSVALCICLGKPADIYLIDVPSAYLEPSQRAATAKVIKWFIRHEKKAAVVVEDDFIMASKLADRYIVLEGQPLVDCTANGPVSVLVGVNLYSSQLDDDIKEREKVAYWLDLEKVENWLDLKKLRLNTQKKKQLLGLLTKFLKK